MTESRNLISGLLFPNYGGDDETRRRGSSLFLYDAVLFSIASIVSTIRTVISSGQQRRALVASVKPSSFGAVKIEDNKRRRVSSLSHIMNLVLRLGVILGIIWYMWYGTTHQNKEETTLEVFQVYKPVPTPDSRNGSLECVNHQEILMQHVFGWSYGQPFVGNYTPPTCGFNHVTLSFTVTSAGRQFDRLAVMFLGDIEVFRTSTAEPIAVGIVWTYVKDMSPLMTLWKTPQKIIFDLGNLVDDTYTGSFDTKLIATFSNVSDPGILADTILPITAQNSSLNRSSTFSVPAQVANSSQTIPMNTSRAIVSIAACGQATEEFWYSNALSSLTSTFSESTGTLYGYSPFREIQLLIDGHLAGVAWPFPTIFTGGIAPGFWRPIVGIDAFDLSESQIDITPFLTLLQDENPHDFEIRVVGLDDDGAGQAKLSQTVGSYWVVTGKIFLFADSSENAMPTQPTGMMPNVEMPVPSLSVSSKYSQNSTGANETLLYTVQAERRIHIFTLGASWIQALHYSSINSLTSQGSTQSTTQITFGTHTSSSVDNNASVSSSMSFWYPLFVNTTFQVFPEKNGFSISASLTRSLNISSKTPEQALFPLPISPGIRSELATSQYGNATYRSVKQDGSYSTGDTSQDFRQDRYWRHVRAVNGSVVGDLESDENGWPKQSRPLTASGSVDQPAAPGRDNIRVILGRGPGCNCE